MYVCMYFFFAPFLASRSGRLGPETAWQLLLRGCIHTPAGQGSAGLVLVALVQSLRFAPAAVDFTSGSPHLVREVPSPLLIFRPLFMPTFAHG